jgi:hypothetical protein
VTYVPPVTSGTNPPGTFNITKPTGTYVPAHPDLAWESAAYADSYDVALDTSDQACGSPYKTYTGITATTVAGDPKDGPSFVCVTAKNKNGATKAGNNGFKITADIEAPPAPEKPTSASGATSTSLEFTFNWAAVTDAGPSGLQNYIVQIGSSAGGSDIFNGPVVETTHSALGDSGKTYFCRVKAVDVAGNESDWSPNSDGVTINAQ